MNSFLLYFISFLSLTSFSAEIVEGPIDFSTPLSRAEKRFNDLADNQENLTVYEGQIPDIVNRYGPGDTDYLYMHVIKMRVNLSYTNGLKTLEAYEEKVIRKTLFGELKGKIKALLKEKKIEKFHMYDFQYVPSKVELVELTKKGKESSRYSDVDIKEVNYDGEVYFTFISNKKVEDTSYMYTGAIGSALIEWQASIDGENKQVMVSHRMPSAAVRLDSKLSLNSRLSPTQAVFQDINEKFIPLLPLITESDREKMSIKTTFLTQKGRVKTVFDYNYSIGSKDLRVRSKSTLCAKVMTFFLDMDRDLK